MLLCCACCAVGSSKRYTLAIAPIYQEQRGACLPCPPTLLSHSSTHPSRVFASNFYSVDHWEAHAVPHLPPFLPPTLPPSFPPSHATRCCSKVPPTFTVTKLFFNIKRHFYIRCAVHRLLFQCYCTLPQVPICKRIFKGVSGPVKAVSLQSSLFRNIHCSHSDFACGTQTFARFLHLQ